MDWVRDLDQLIDEIGAQITFSAHCRSGIVGDDRCGCWRCQGGSPATESKGWQETAELIDRAVGVGVRLGRRNRV